MSMTKRFHFDEEFLPSVFTGFACDRIHVITDEWPRASFAGNIEMPDDVVHFDSVGIREFCHELCAVMNHLFGEIPVTIANGFARRISLMFYQVHAKAVVIFRAAFV